MPVPLAAAPSGLSFRSTVVDPEQPIMIGSLELAESSPTNLTVRFNSERRVITRGFMFRPDSDTLLPESSPMIRQVVDALDNDSTLVLVVDVHTTPTADTTNWSRIRARSLKSLFTDRYAVAPDRLIIRGSGSNQPIDGTDAPKAARNNERVVIARLAKGIRHQ